MNKNIKYSLKSTSLSNEQREYLKQSQKYSNSIKLYQWLIFVIFLGLWEICSKLEIINSFVFCSPSKIVICFFDMLLNKSLFTHIGITLSEVFVAFLLVIIFSLLLSVILWWNPKLSKIIEPYLVVLNSLPKSALAPLLIVWLGATTKTIIVCAISLAIFGSILNIYTSFTTVESEKLKLIQTLKGNRLQCLYLVVIPSCIPNIFSVMKVNIGLSLVGVVIGEFLASKAGLGYLIIYGSQTFKMSWVLMSIVLLCIIAMILYKIIDVIEKVYSNNRN